MSSGDEFLSISILLFGDDTGNGQIPSPLGNHGKPLFVWYLQGNHHARDFRWCRISFTYSI